MDYIVAALVMFIILFGTIESKPIEEKAPYVRHIDEFFDKDYFKGVEL